MSQTKQNNNKKGQIIRRTDKTTKTLNNQMLDLAFTEFSKARKRYVT